MGTITNINGVAIADLVTINNVAKSVIVRINDIEISSGGGPTQLSVPSRFSGRMVGRKTIRLAWDSPIIVDAPYVGSWEIWWKLSSGSTFALLVDKTNTGVGSEFYEYDLSSGDPHDYKIRAMSNGTPLDSNFSGVITVTP